MTWRHDPALLRRLLAHEAQQNPALRRRMAILDVLQGGITPREALIHAVEAAVGSGAFGASPHTRLWSDMRALRDAGFAIGYSRTRGMSGYFLRAESLPDPAARVIAQVLREVDFAHLDRVAQVAPARRVDAAFEMIAFAHDVAAAGQREREQPS